MAWSSWTWSDRFDELRRIRVFTDRVWGLAVIAGVVTVVVPVVALVRGEVALLWWLPGLLVVDALTVRALDRRLAWRAGLRARWASAAFVAAAARYGMRVDVGCSALPSGSSRLETVAHPFVDRRMPYDVLGTVHGVVRGREVALIEWEARRGSLLLSQVLGVARLDRMWPCFRVARRTRWRKLRNEPSPRFSDWFKVSGSGSVALGPALEAWMLGDGEGFSFEVVDDLVACRWWINRLEPEDIGVYLGALVGFADRLGRSS